jgi:hypothetical protein
VIALKEKETVPDGPTREVHSVVGAALERYCLGGAHISDLATSGDQTFRVEVPESWTAPHPYLGLIAGRRFVMRVRVSSRETISATLLEADWLAGLLRDTDLEAPEPVPACDGSLAPSLWTEESGEVHTILYRW